MIKNKQNYTKSRSRDLFKSEKLFQKGFKNEYKKTR